MQINLQFSERKYLRPQVKGTKYNGTAKQQSHFFFFKILNDSHDN